MQEVYCLEKKQCRKFFWRAYSAIADLRINFLIEDDSPKNKTGTISCEMIPVSHYATTVAAHSAKFLSFFIGLHPFKYAPLNLASLTSSRIASRQEPKVVWRGVLLAQNLNSLSGDQPSLPLPVKCLSVFPKASGKKRCPNALSGDG